MELIINSKGKDVTVFYDEQHHELIKKYKWRIRTSKNKMYAITAIYLKEKQNNTSIFMHNLIMGAKGIDHKNGNGCDNRSENLRKATQSQNAKNMQLSKLNKFGVKGASYCKKKNMYSVHITNNYKHIFLGYYSSLIEASNKYNEAAIKYHGEFANLNVLTPEKIKELESKDLSIDIKRRAKKVSKLKGVSFQYGKFKARIIINGKHKWLGAFNTEEEAHIAYVNAKNKLK